MSAVDLDLFGYRRFPSALAAETPFKLRGLVVDWGDGDTLTALLDQALGCRFEVAVRLNNVRAPETRTTDLAEKRRGYEALEVARAVCPPNTPISLLSTRLERDYDRSFLRAVGDVRFARGNEVLELNEYLKTLRPDLFVAEGA